MYIYACFYIKRRRPENMIVAGLWFGAEHPTFNTFMTPICDALKELQKNG